MFTGKLKFHVFFTQPSLYKSHHRNVLLIFDPNFFEPKLSVIHAQKDFEIFSAKTMYFLFYLMGSFWAASCKELQSS